MSRRIIALFCALLLLLPLVPNSRAADEVCFTAINDTVLPLAADSMPVWSSGLLYVPYYVFDPGTTGISLGVNAIYNKANGTVSIFNMNQMMIYDIEAGTCTDPHSNTDLSSRAIRRNGTIYVPAARICSFFGMSNPSYSATDYGYLVRIRNGDETLSNKQFIKAAGNLMATRLKDYNQTLEAEKEEETPPPAGQTQPPEQEIPATVPTYLAFRCQTGEAGVRIAHSLDTYGASGLFFFAPEQITAQGDLIRQLLGTGHSVGILALGNSVEETFALLDEGAAALEEMAHGRTFFALTPKPHRQQVEQLGWACWNDSVTAIPTPQSASQFARATIRTLPDKGRAYLTLDDSNATAQVMDTLLSQLREQKYITAIPRETRL